MWISIWGPWMSISNFMGNQYFKYLCPVQVSSCEVPVIFWILTFSFQILSFFTAWTYPKLIKLYCLLSIVASSISTTRWRYNQGECVLAYNSYILCCTFKTLYPHIHWICAEFCDMGHTHFHLFVFFKFAKGRRPTFSNSSQAISPISMKLCTPHLWTLLTKSC